MIYFLFLIFGINDYNTTPGVSPGIEEELMF